MSHIPATARRAIFNSGCERLLRVTKIQWPFCLIFDNIEAIELRGLLTDCTVIAEIDKRAVAALAANEFAFSRLSHVLLRFSVTPQARDVAVHMFQIAPTIPTKHFAASVAAKFGSDCGVACLREHAKDGNWVLDSVLDISLIYLNDRDAADRFLQSITHAIREKLCSMATLTWTGFRDSDRTPTEDIRQFLVDWVSNTMGAK